MMKFVKKRSNLTINVPTYSEVGSSFNHDGRSLPALELDVDHSFENMLKGAGRVLESLGGLAG